MAKRRISVRTAENPKKTLNDLVPSCIHDPLAFILGTLPAGRGEGPDTWQAGWWTPARQGRGLSAERVLEEVRRLAFSDIWQVLRREGQPAVLAEMSPEALACVASVKVMKKNLYAGDEGLPLDITAQIALPWLASTT
jgi:hypothetical protein